MKKAKGKWKGRDKMGEGKEAAVYVCKKGEGEKKETRRVIFFYLKILPVPFSVASPISLFRLVCPFI